MGRYTHTKQDGLNWMEEEERKGSDFVLREPLQRFAGTE